MDLLPIIQQFAEQILTRKIEIYNEASIQYELAIFLRQTLGSNYKIQLERNIRDFVLIDNGTKFLKKEMDIVVFNKNEMHCIELKFPTNGQYPEQMFSSCKDIGFLEQLTSSGFSDCYFIMFAKDPLFYSDLDGDGIYHIFRKNKLIKGTIQKPTGQKDEWLPLKGEYSINWNELFDSCKYFAVAVHNRETI